MTKTQLVYFCSAARVTDPIHYDVEMAREFGFPGVVVNGSLRVAWLAQTLADLVDPPSFLSHLACSHHGMMIAGDAPVYEATCAGPAEETEGGYLLPCAVAARVGDKVVDRAQGSLTLRN